MSARNRGAGLAVMLLACTALAPAAAFGQADTVVAQAAPATRFDIPAGPLAAALAQFGDAAGLQLLYPAELARGEASPGVTGTMPRNEALRRLLSGTGLTWRFTGADTVTLERVPGGDAAGGGLTLDPIVVTGAGGTAWGPVDGYVAGRSATGSKTDTPLIETPASVSVIGRPQMEDQAVRTVDEALRYSPGVRAQPFGTDSRFDWFYIRGFRAYQDGLFRDGLSLFSTALAGWRAEPYGLERIEQLRGPSSFLYGGGSPGGLVNLVSKRPPEETLHSAEAGIDEHGRAFGAFDIGGPLDQDGQWLYRVTALVHSGGTETEKAEDFRGFIAPSLTWKPNEDTTLTILASYQHDDLNQAQGFLPYVGTVKRAGFGRIPRDLFTSEPGYDKFVRNQAMIGYQLEHRFDDTWTVRQNFRFAHLDLFHDGMFGVGYADAAQTQLARLNYQTRPEVNFVTVDNQAEARFDTGPLQHTALVGLDYKRYQIDDDQASGPAAPLDIVHPHYGQIPGKASRYILNRQVMSQLGVYVQDQISWDDQWFLTATGRYDWVTSSIDNHLNDTSTTSSDGAFTGRIALLYKSALGLAPYVSYSTFFNPVVGTNFYGRPFDPETGDQIEVGVKYQPEGMESFFSAALFDLRRENTTTTDPNNILNQVQTGEVRSRGVELEANASLAEGLSLVASYTRYDLEVTKSNDVDKGKVPIGVPQELGSLWLDYKVQHGSLEGVGLGGGVRYVGASYADAANTLKVPASTVFDAAVSYGRDNWRVALNASNLFDRTYVASCSSPTACYYGDGRVVKLTLGYNW
ncbi:TonB-dependent siderophore receptor [Inquilinus limosus]|nr:TonB-dependent siderophore receptor [Inquilinus limosus]